MLASRTQGLYLERVNGTDEVKKHMTTQRKPDSVLPAVQCLEQLHCLPPSTTLLSTTLYYAVYTKLKALKCIPCMQALGSLIIQ